MQIIYTFYRYMYSNYIPYYSGKGPHIIIFLILADKIKSMIGSECF